MSLSQGLEDWGKGPQIKKQAGFVSKEAKQANKNVHVRDTLFLSFHDGFCCENLY